MLPQRKEIRLKEYDYNTSGYYFITICTKNKAKILCDIVGDGVYDIPNIQLSKLGEIADKYIKKLNGQYSNVSIDKYVIMPNHIHLIIKITEFFDGEKILFGTSQAPYPTSATNAIIPKFVSLYKRYCNRECNANIFQRSFYDHVIRGEQDYKEIWEYIEENPAKWQEDKFYIE